MKLKAWTDLMRPSAPDILATGCDVRERSSMLRWVCLWHSGTRPTISECFLDYILEAPGSRNQISGKDLLQSWIAEI
jgi:hypothetical protein